MIVPGIPFVQGRNDYHDADGRKYGLAIHNTSNDASDQGEASYATRRTDGISAHFYVDGDSITQSLDTDDCAGHAGSAEGNGHAIAIEITGANGWTRQQWLARVAWGRLARVLAVLCRHYGIAVRRASVAEMRTNPRVKAFYGHDDMRQAWGGTTHTDPGPNFPWDHLLNMVRAEMENDMPTAKEIAAEVWAYPLIDPLIGKPKAAGAFQRYADAMHVGTRQALKPLSDLLLGIAQRVDLDPAEIEQLKAALAVPTPQDNAAAVVAKLGAAATPEEKAALLRAALGNDAVPVGRLLAGQA